jgi:prepilin-type N-terminal cleavage/methylation domain-containing protein
MKYNVKLQRGFSMIEVLITVAVLAIGLMSVARFNNFIIQEGNETRSRTEAINLAQDQLEQMRSFTDFTGYSAISSGQQTLGPASLGPDVTIDGLHNLYTRSWSVTAEPSNPTHAKVINVTISWPDLQGQVTADTTVSLSSVIADNNPSTSALAMKDLSSYSPPPSGGNGGEGTNTDDDTPPQDDTNTTGDTSGDSGDNQDTTTTDNTSITTEIVCQCKGNGTRFQGDNPNGWCDTCCAAHYSAGSMDGMSNGQKANFTCSVDQDGNCTPQ